MSQPFSLEQLQALSDLLAANGGAALIGTSTGNTVEVELQALIAGVVNRGGYNADTNTPDLDTSPSGVENGDMYFVTTAGTFFTELVEVNDVIIANQDNPTTLAHWIVLQKNLDQATETAPGFSRTATQVEVDTGTDDEAYVSSKKFEDSNNVAAIGQRSGVTTGMVVTINGGDNTKFDVSSGAGIIIDWSTGSRVPLKITYAGATAITITAGIGTSVFTSLYVDENENLVQSTGVQLTAQQRRKYIVLNSLIHVNLTTINSISISGIPSFQAIDAFDDYIRAIGSINSGNGYSAASTDLTIQKAAGTTTFPYINKDVEAQNPAVQVNAVQDPLTVSDTNESYRDGVGGFTIVPSFTVIDPDLYDDGSGVLAAVSNNKWTIRRLYFFGQNNGTLINYGQAQYNSLTEAEAAIFIEDPILSPFVLSGVFKSVLIVKKGATDLSDLSEAKFLDIISQASTSAAGAGAQDLQNTFDLSADPEIVVPTGLEFSIEADTDGAQIIQDWKDELGVARASVTGDGTMTAVDFVGDGSALTGIDQNQIAQLRNVQTGTTYTVLDSDHGKLVTLDNGSAIAVTIPTGLRENFGCSFLQIAAGKPTFSGGATILAFAGNTTMAGQFAFASVTHLGASNVVALQGNLI